MMENNRNRSMTPTNLSFNVIQEGPKTKVASSGSKKEGALPMPELLPGDTLEFIDNVKQVCSGIVLSTEVEPEWRVEVHTLNYVYSHYMGRRRSVYSPEQKKSIELLPKENFRFMDTFHIENRSLPENIKERIKERFSALFKEEYDGILKINRKKLKKRVGKEGMGYLLNDDDAEDDPEDEDDSVEVTGSVESSSDEEERALEEKNAKRERERQESTQNLNALIQEAQGLSPTMQRIYNRRIKKEKGIQE